jgi:hypothetical protein
MNSSSAVMPDVAQLGLLVAARSGGAGRVACFASEAIAMSAPV